MSVDVLDILRTAADSRLALWVEIESIPELLTAGDMPYSEATTGRTHKQVLVPAELRGRTGAIDMLSGVASGADVTLRILDRTGWWGAMLAPGIASYLASPLGRADVQLEVADASVFAASGTVWVLGQRRTYAAIAGNFLTGLSAPTYTLGYTQKAVALPDGTMPSYRVGTTPWYLDGRYVRVWGVPLTVTGAAMVDYADRLELWRGVVTAIPLSIDGISWRVQCSGLERLLTGTLPIGQAKATLLQTELFRHAGASPQEGDGGWKWWSKAFYSYMTEGGRIWIGSGANRFKISAHRYLNGAHDYQSGVLTITIPVGFYGYEILDLVAGEINAALEAAGFDEFSAGGGAAGLARVVADAEEGVLRAGCIYSGADEYLTLLGLVDSPSSVFRHLGMHCYSVYAGEDTYWIGYYHVPDKEAWTQTILWRPSGYPWYVGATGTAIPLVIPQGSDWPASGGYFRIDETGELVLYADLVSTGILTPEGWLVYEAQGCQRGKAGTEPTVLTGQALAADQQDAELPDRAITSVGVIEGANVFEALAGALTGVGEAGVNGAYSAAWGCGLPADHIDLAGLGALMQLPPLSGPRGAVLEGKQQLGTWLRDNLALEGYVLTPGWVEGEYRLTCRKLGTPGPDSYVYAATIDYERAVSASGGLGTIVNRLRCSPGGDAEIIFNDLPSQVSFSCIQERELTISTAASAGNLLSLTPAASRIFHFLGVPATVVDVALSPQARILQPGDWLSMALGKSGAQGVWLILAASPVWVPGTEFQRVTALLLPALASCWYAPTGKIAAVDLVGGTIDLEPAEYSAGTSKIAPWLPARDVHHFLPGGVIWTWSRGTYSAGAQRTILAADWDSDRLTLDSVIGLGVGDLLTYDWSSQQTEPQVVTDYLFLDDDKEWSD